MNTESSALKALVAKLYLEKYPDAKVVFLAGSVVRGEGTSTSDLDLVVVYESLPNAYRDSFNYDGWPVEAFVHDPQTLKYFFDEVDGLDGYPSLAAMVSEGLEIPVNTRFASRMKAMANTSLREGPPKWTQKEFDSSRYMITDLIEDIKDPRNSHELQAIASVLYSAIANYYFRSKGLWSAKGKTIPRRLATADPEFARLFLAAFDSAFIRSSTDDIVALATTLLKDTGGFHFAGFRLDAPSEWRKE